MSSSSPLRAHSDRTENNARLTSWAGLLLFVLLAAQGITILRIHRLGTAHIVIGFVLLGPLAVKLATTGWRFARYYAGDEEYGRAGPPQVLLRVLAPLVVASTVLVFATGIALLAVHPGHGSLLLLLHKASFIIWFGATTVHVLAYLGPALQRSLADLAGRGPARVLASRRWRAGVLVASVVIGSLIAVPGLAWAHPWAGWLSRGHGGDR
jgi:hypothetical protein